MHEALGSIPSIEKKSYDFEWMQKNTLASSVVLI
jgi:hypothetical protein